MQRCDALPSKNKTKHVRYSVADVQSLVMHDILEGKSAAGAGETPLARSSSIDALDGPRDRQCVIFLCVV